MSPKTKRQGKIIAGMTVLISFVALVISGTIFLNYRIEESQRLQCGVLQVSLMPRPKPPMNPDAAPSTAYGKELQKYTRQQELINAQGRRELQRLAERYKCPERTNE